MAGQTAPPVSLPPTPTPPAPGTPKKAVWKRWWIWVVVLLVVAAVASASEDEPPPPPLVTMPLVERQAVAEATRTLERLKVNVEVSVRREFSAELAGTVLAQIPSAGEEVVNGSLVELTIARPLPKVPEVVGLNLSDARNALREGGFEVDVRRVVSEAAKDTVLSQRPSPGVQAQPGLIIVLKVAKRAPPPPPPPPPGNCTPGYSQCLQYAPDYDCAGGSGNGPEYVYGTVTVTGSDPYGLDADNDGYGCE